MADEKPVRAVLDWEYGGKQELVLREGDTAEIGREESNTVTLPLGQVSRHHAVIAWRDGHFEVQDLGSMNGTKVNGQLLSGPYKLKDGDKIGVFSVTLVYSTVKEAPKPDVTVNQTLIVMPNAPQPRLIISAGPQEGREIRLVAGAMTIGRATGRMQDWDIALQDRAISRPHSQITGEEGGFSIADSGSANGTLVNGETIAETRTLNDGDVIVIGETTLIFRSK